MSQAQKAVRAMVRVSHQLTPISAARVSQLSQSNLLGVSTLDNCPLRTAEPPQSINTTNHLHLQDGEVIGYWTVDCACADQEDPGKQQLNNHEDERFDLPPLPVKRWEEHTQIIQNAGIITAQITQNATNPTTPTANKLLQQSLIVSKSN